MLNTSAFNFSKLGVPKPVTADIVNTETGNHSPNACTHQDPIQLWPAHGHQISNTTRGHVDMTYIEALSSTSWVVARGDIIQRSVPTRVQKGIEEAERGFADIKVCVI
jgi:hypothetical protein